LACFQPKRRDYISKGLVPTVPGQGAYVAGRQESRRPLCVSSPAGSWGVL